MHLCEIQYLSGTTFRYAVKMRLDRAVFTLLEERRSHCMAHIDFLQGIAESRSTFDGRTFKQN